MTYHAEEESNQSSYKATHGFPRNTFPMAATIVGGLVGRRRPAEKHEQRFSDGAMIQGKQAGPQIVAMVARGFPRQSAPVATNNLVVRAAINPNAS